MTTALTQLQYLLEPFLPLLEGGTEDIAINKPFEAWVLRGGVWTMVEMPDLDWSILVDMTILAASVSEQHVSKRNPLLFTDIPMPNGIKLRLMAILPPAVEPGCISWTLRQPSSKIHPVSSIKDRYDVSRWANWKRRGDTNKHEAALALYDAQDLEGFLSYVVKARYNILLCGATGAGKTQLGITCIDEIPANERIITIENTREYRLAQPNHVHLLYSQGSQGMAQITQEQLQVASLRSRPTRVFVQELLDENAADTYVTQVISGHPGSITTIHGKHPAEAFKKLFGLVSKGKDRDMILNTLCSAIDVIIPLYNEGGTFYFGETFFAPDATRRGETAADLLKDVA